jgi:NADPH2:quinone reductase
MAMTQKTMMAWQACRYGEFEKVLRLERCPLPTPTGSGAVVRVGAIGLNFLDVLAIAGKYQEKSSPPFIPGVEAAGDVIETGPESPFQVGDRVMTVGKAAYAQYMAVHPGTTFCIPERLPMADAAAMQLIYQTAHVALVHRARLRSNAFLLVHAGAGGTGTAAIQIGRALGARVIATAGSDEKLDVCLRSGAEAAINYRKADFVQRTLEITQGRGVDVVFDPVGGNVFEQSTRCIAFEGRIVVIGFASGSVPSIAVNRILLKNIAIIGLFWGNYRQFDLQRIEATQTDLYRLYDAGKIKPVIYREFGFNSLPQALSALSQRHSYGKVIVNPTMMDENSTKE